MSRERLRVSFNMGNAQHAAAWETIHQHTGKQRSEFIIACVNKIADEHRLENALSRMLDGKLAGLSFQPPATAADAIQNADELPDAMLDFADSF